MRSQRIGHGFESRYLHLLCKIRTRECSDFVRYAGFKNAMPYGILTPAGMALSMQHYFLLSEAMTLFTSLRIQPLNRGFLCDFRLKIEDRGIISKPVTF